MKVDVLEFGWSEFGLGTGLLQSRFPPPPRLMYLAGLDAASTRLLADTVPAARLVEGRLLLLLRYTLLTIGENMEMRGVSHCLVLHRQPTRLFSLIPSRADVQGLLLKAHEKEQDVALKCSRFNSNSYLVVVWPFRSIVSHHVSQNFSRGLR